MEVVSVYLHTFPQPSLRSVAERFNIPPSTLQHWVEHHKTHGHLSDIKQTGRPRKIDARGDRELLRNVRAEPKQVLRNIAVKNGISINTARRHLNELDNSPMYVGKNPSYPPPISPVDSSGSRRPKTSTSRPSCLQTRAHFKLERAVELGVSVRLGQLTFHST